MVSSATPTTMMMDVPPMARLLTPITRAGDNGRDGDNRQVERTEHGDLIEHLVDKVGGGLAGAEAGDEPAVLFRLLATSTGLNCIVE